MNQTIEEPLPSADQTTTIFYQGQEIEAEKVNYIDGRLTIAPWLDFEGEDDLFRDETGRYFLRRRATVLDADGENERDASGRTLCHRLSVKAAILWATMRANALTNDLRQDVAKLAELGDHASDLLRDHLADNPDHDPRDVVNAALDYMLGVDEAENWHPHGAIALAKARRLGLEGGEEVAS